MKQLTAFHLKLIAIIAMFINHLGHAFKYTYNSFWWEMSYLVIGMLTFPIMAYLLVEGFFYTRNRWKYAVRLGLFSCLSYIPYHYLFFSPFPLWFGNNIMFVLMLGVVLMMLCERFKNSFFQMLMAFAFMLMTFISDWGLFGMIIIFAFYKTYGKPYTIKWVLGIVSLIMFGFVVSVTSLEEALVNFGMLAAIPLLLSYNGNRGYSPMWLKWGFYLFYPMHLLILWGIRHALLGY